MSRLALVSPIDGAVIAERSALAAQAISATIEQCRRAQAEWAVVPLQERLNILGRAVDRLETQADAAALELAREIGRPVRYGGAEVVRAAERARYMLSIAERSLGEICIEHSARQQRLIRREPIGVVLVILPWNYPYLTAINSLIPALAAGNAVLLKPSIQAALSSERLAACFAAETPAHLVQVVHADDGTTLALAQAQGVGHVVFTGSVAVGRIIGAAAGSALKTMTLELGGKDPAYVREDAAFDHAVAELVDGAYFNSGQSCCGVERIYIAERLYERFASAFVEQAKVLRLGNPLERGTTLGPMARAAGAEEVRRQVCAALAGGARCLIGGTQWLEQGEPSQYVPADVLVDVRDDLDVQREETFGPIVTLTPVDDDSHALRLMNASRYGLTASLWTSDPERAQQLAGQLHCGTVYLNRCDYLDPALPWSGRKDSGAGPSLSHLAFDVLTRPKSLHLRLVPPGA